MPIAKFKCIREVSSEDSNFTAENLLKQEPGKKWKTKTAGEKSAYVIFELEKPVQITGIDIGNEHSAFVEVLVSASGCCAEDFTEILITCSFMTPIESKNSSNPNRVRCFNKDALVETAATKKWHLVKVLCTQPFNKHIQYGLSFIKLHIVEIEVPKKNLTTKPLVPEDFLIQKETSTTVDNAKNDDQTAQNKTKIFAKFALREESSDSDSESSTALFSRWKKSRENDTLPTTAAAIRQASLISNLRKSTEAVKRTLPFTHNTSVNENQHKEIRDRNKTDLLFGAEEVSSDTEDKKLQRLSKHIEAEKEQLKAQSELTKKKENKTERSERSSKQLDNRHTENNNKEKDSPLNESIKPSSSRKRTSSPSGGPSKKQKSEATHEYRPFNQLLRGVVLVISGIQNPDRANLRGKAIAMGAKYKADWEAGCTHLICAFKNTPKYNQVKGKGKIVKRTWIEKCFDLKKYLPWRRYALDSDEEAKLESDNEILDETFKPFNKQDVDRRSRSSVESITDKPFALDSGSDTDDDIERIMQKNNKENEVPAKEQDAFDVTTEEEEYIQRKTNQSKASLLFFDNMKFFIVQGNKDQLERCIKHYGGSITQKTSEADVVVAENTPETFKSENFSGPVVRSQWVFECNDMEQKLPMDPYIVA